MTAWYYDFPLREKTPLDPVIVLNELVPATILISRDSGMAYAVSNNKKLVRLSPLPNMAWYGTHFNTIDFEDVSEKVREGSVIEPVALELKGRIRTKYSRSVSPGEVFALTEEEYDPFLVLHGAQVFQLKTGRFMQRDFFQGGEIFVFGSARLHI